MTMQILAVDLDLADDAEYVNIFTESGMRDSRVWLMMLEPERVDRTLELVRDLKLSLEQQLSLAKQYQNGGEEEWRRKVLRMLRRVDIYLADVKAEVKRLNQEEAEESAAGERDRWRSIAGLLANLLKGNPALEMIRLPDDQTTVAEWAEIREEKARRRAGVTA